MRYLALSRITSAEFVLWGLFFCLFLFSVLLDFDVLEDVLLVIGTLLGVICLYFIVTLVGSYKKNKKKIDVWGCRFLLFKILPVVLSLIFDH